MSRAEAWVRHEKATQARKDEAGTRLKALHRVEELLDAGMKTMQARAQVAGEMRAEGVKGAFNRTMPALERDRTVFHAMEAVNVDGHVVDVFTRWPGLPGGKEVKRPVLIGVQYLYSGFILSCQVQRTFYETIKQYGIPRHVDGQRAGVCEQAVDRAGAKPVPVQGACG